MRGGSPDGPWLSGGCLGYFLSFWLASFWNVLTTLGGSSCYSNNLEKAPACLGLPLACLMPGPWILWALNFVLFLTSITLWFLGVCSVPGCMFSGKKFVWDPGNCDYREFQVKCHSRYCKLKFQNGIGLYKWGLRRSKWRKKVGCSSKICLFS